MQYVTINHLLNSISPEWLTAAKCILFPTVATISLLAQLAMQLAGEMVFTALKQELFDLWEKEIFRPGASWLTCQLAW